MAVSKTSIPAELGKLTPDEVSPVILGGDVGAYSVARAFHERYGVRSTVISGVATGPVRHSKIIDLVTLAEMSRDDVLIPALIEMAGAGGALHGAPASGADQASRTTPASGADRALPDAQPSPDAPRRILLGSGDWLVHRIVKNRAALEPYYVIPYVDLEVMERVTVKANFSQLCEELGIPHPRTAVHRVGVDDPERDYGLRFPMVAKPGDSSLYRSVRFAGKKKVFHIADAEELARTLSTVAASEYRGDFILQERIEGPDSNMRVLTCYTDSSGQVKFSAFGHVLLEEHTPGALGNPAVVMTGEHHEAAVADAIRLLDHVEWRGYSNFDLKLDERTGELVFFELNPRLGRSNYYVTAAGQNTAELYVQDLLAGEEIPQSHAKKPHLFSIVPYRVLRRYLPEDQVARVRELVKSRRRSNPLWYWPVEKDPRRVAYVLLATLNQGRKFRKFHPVTRVEEER